MEKGQWSLNDFPVRQSRAFLRSLWSHIALKEYTRFDQLTGDKFRRESDESMTVEHFLALSWRSRHLRLHIDSTTPHEIRYHAGIYISPVSKFAWLECPLTEKNYAAVLGIFQQTYGLPLEAFPSLGERVTKNKKY